MWKLTKDQPLSRTNLEALAPRFSGAFAKNAWVLMFATTIVMAMVLSACGGSSSPGGSQQSGALSGNWQFTVAGPPDQSFLGGLQGGFLLQKSGGVTGAAVYSVSLPGQGGGNPTVCNSGSAPITGTISGQTVTLTAVAGTQTFTYTGTLSSDGSTVAGTYTSSAGTAPDGTACGTAQSGLSWSATSVPPATGTITGSFHSTAGAAGLSNQDFLVTGSLIQGENLGASNATVTGTLTFVDPVSLLSDYPCFDTASVNGQISGSSIILQIIATDGSNIGQIGAPPGGSSVQPVKFASTSSGNILRSDSSPAYALNTKACPGVSLANPGDQGNICLALNSTSACQQPISLSPALLTFPAQILGSTPTTQTITVTNTSSATLNGLTLNWQNDTLGDFTNQPNFTEANNTCAPPITLLSGQSCAITVTFAPQQSCPWLPVGNPPSQLGAPPSWCPVPLTGSLTVTSPASAENDKKFSVPVTGNGVSFLQASLPELDFGAEAVSQASLPQLLSFTNHSSNPVQILPHSQNCTSPLPRPLQNNNEVSGLQVVSNGAPSPQQLSAITGPYSCDSDSTTHQPNFQISSDTCSGAVLDPQQTCSLQIAFVPQPVYVKFGIGLDYFLELNTLQCTSTVAPLSPPDCEIDSGRFPVELRTNPPSPLRMTPGAGLDFGNQTVGNASVQQTITLFNDPTDPNAGTVDFVGKVSVKGDYSETDDCPFSLAPGASCTLTVTFKPKIVGFDPGTLTINYTPELTGAPQIVYLRGTGQ
jgi:hypothetical protein